MIVCGKVKIIENTSYLKKRKIKILELDNCWYAWLLAGRIEIYQLL
jgi:hypothetical protein